jgi:hypothetical protein
MRLRFCGFCHSDVYVYIQLFAPCVSEPFARPYAVLHIVYLQKNCLSLIKIFKFFIMFTQKKKKKLGCDRSAAAPTNYSRPDAVRAILEAYFSQVRFSVQNAVPKLVMRFLVSGTQRAVTQGVFSAVPREPAALKDLLREEGEAAERRRALGNEVRSLEAAFATLNGAHR